MDFFCFFGGFQAFSSEVGETTLSASISTLTTDDGEEEVIDTKAVCNMADIWTQVADNLAVTEIIMKHML